MYFERLKDYVAGCVDKKELNEKYLEFNTGLVTWLQGRNHRETLTEWIRKYNIPMFVEYRWQCWEEFIISMLVL